MTSRKIGFVLAAALLEAGSAAAQDLKRFEISGFVGGLTINHDLGSVSNLFLTVTGKGENGGFGKLFGVRVGYHLFEDILVEGNVSRSSNDFTSTVQDQKLGQFDAGRQFSATDLTVSGNILVDFDLENGFVPFATAGIGWNRSKPENPIAGLDSVGSLAVNVGGGVKYFLKPWIGARFDARYHFISDGLAYSGAASSPRHGEFSVGAVVRPF